MGILGVREFCGPQSDPDVVRSRAQFPALREKTFLDTACVSLTPLAATEAIQQFLDVALHCPSRSATLHHIAMDEMRSKARAEAARLINADGIGDRARREHVSRPDDRR